MCGKVVQEQTYWASCSALEWGAVKEKFKSLERALIVGLGNLWHRVIYICKSATWTHERSKFHHRRLWYCWYVLPQTICLWRRMHTLAFCQLYECFNSRQLRSDETLNCLLYTYKHATFTHGFLSSRWQILSTTKKLASDAVKAKNNDKCT